MPLEWNGDEVIAKVTEAARVSINDTTAATQGDAETTHWWANRSGNLEAQLATEDATIDGDRVTGSVGVHYAGGGKGARDGFYGLFLEYRFPWIRPAGDRNFPTLAARIREKLR